MPRYWGNDHKNGGGYFCPLLWGEGAMTRRYIVFYDDITSFYYSAPEFNGDKTEMAAFASQDSCDKDWPEIVQEFQGVDTLQKFKAVSNKAQGYYHSFLGDTPPLPITRILFAHVRAKEIEHNLWEAGM
jgi:hypothetical protein